MKRIVKILTVIITAFTFSALFISASTFAQPLPTTVTIKPSLSISIPSSTVLLSLDPSLSSFGYASSTVTVATNNPNGYKLYLYSTNNTTNLVNTNDSTQYIETLSSSTTQDSFPVNSWGYRISSGNTGDSSITDLTGTNYYPFVSNKLISSSSVATNAISSTLDFATKIDYEKPAGQYSIALNFKALPQTTTHYMQDFAADPTLKDTVCTEEPTMVMDKRDGHTYAIAKLKDGKCWMLQNLRLGDSLEPVAGSMTLTSEDTNISSTDTINPRSEFVLTNRVADGSMPGKNNIWDGPALYCATDYGCYYNFYTATAGIRSEAREGVNPDSSVVTGDNTDVPSTICPKGWTLPTGGEVTGTHTSDIQSMLDVYNYNIDPAYIVAGRLLVNPSTSTENVNGSSSPGFLIGGDCGLSGIVNIQGLGLYWTRTVFSISESYRFYIYTGDVLSNSHYYRNVGKSVRCLAQ